MSKDEQNHPAFQWGTDAQFLRFISSIPSVIDGDYNQYDPDRNIACHVRRLKFGAGRGVKPPFCAVPMTHKQHMLQESKNGEVRVLKHYKNLNLTPEEAAAWFENAADETLKKWIEHQKSKRNISCQ